MPKKPKPDRWEVVDGRKVPVYVISAHGKPEVKEQVMGVARVSISGMATQTIRANKGELGKIRKYWVEQTGGFYPVSVEFTPDNAGDALAKILQPDKADTGKSALERILEG